MEIPFRRNPSETGSDVHSTSSDLTAYLDRCINERLFPGCCIGLLRSGERRIITRGRLTYDCSSPAVSERTVYDVASITKAIPTSSLALQLIGEEKIFLESRLIEFVPEFSGEFGELITIGHLLTQTLDFDFRLSDKKELPAPDLLGAILSANLRRPPSDSFSYANATSILLGMVVERVLGQRLDEAASERFFGPLGMTGTTFFPETFVGAAIAPTEDDPWRGRIVCGEVHDESAWALRKVLVAGSAGLFSTAGDLLRFSEMLLNDGEMGGIRFFPPKTMRLISSNMLPDSLGARTACGWELEQPVFMGSGCTPTTFGKTGFTGCAVVADPARRAALVFLTNHTFPKRRSDRNAINEVRRTLADLPFPGSDRDWWFSSKNLFSFLTPSTIYSILIILISLMVVYNAAFNPFEGTP